MENQKAVVPLRDGEAEVIRGSMEGLKTKTICINMGVSEGKVKRILQRLFARTAVRKRSQLVRLALEGTIYPKSPAQPAFNATNITHGKTTAVKALENGNFFAVTEIPTASSRIVQKLKRSIDVARL